MDGQHQRIVSLLPAATEILFELGLGEKVLAVSHDCDFPPSASQLPSVTSANINVRDSGAAIDREVKTLVERRLPLYAINQQLLIDLQPDLIVTQDHCDVCAVSLDEVRSLVATTPLRNSSILALNPQRLDDVFESIRQIARSTDAGCQGETLCKSLTHRLKKVQERLPQQRRPKVACVEWIDPLMIAGNWVPELVRLAGAEPVIGRDGEYSEYCDWQAVVDASPAIVLVAPCGFDLARSLEEWNSLPSATRHALERVVQRIVVMDGNALLNRPGPRVVDTVEALADIIHSSVTDRPGQFQQAWPSV